MEASDELQKALGKDFSDRAKILVVILMVLTILWDEEGEVEIY